MQLKKKSHSYAGPLLLFSQLIHGKENLDRTFASGESLTLPARLTAPPPACLLGPPLPRLAAGDFDTAFGLPVIESRAVTSDPLRDLGSDCAEPGRPGDEPPLRLRAGGLPPGGFGAAPLAVGMRLGRRRASAWSCADSVLDVLSRSSGLMAFMLAVLISVRVMTGSGGGVELLGGGIVSGLDFWSCSRTRTRARVPWSSMFLSSS